LFWNSKRYQESGYYLSPEKNFLPLKMGSPRAAGAGNSSCNKKGEKLFSNNKRIQGLSHRRASENIFPALHWDPLPRWESGKSLLLLYKKVEIICRNFLSCDGFYPPHPAGTGNAPAFL
jgi:hypothetical protein